MSSTRIAGYTVWSAPEELRGVMARPAGDGPRPAVLVVHENKGIQPYVREVVAGLAEHGYVAVAPDLLTRAGGTEAFPTEQDAVDALGALDKDLLVDDLVRTMAFVRSLEGVDPTRVGAIGFCFGGTMTWALATKDRDLAVAVPFYGKNPPLDAAADIEAPVFAIYGELDERVNVGMDAIEAAMKKYDKNFTKTVYAGAQHAFHNHTNPRRYNATAAAQAWQDCLAWLDKYLIA